MFPNYEVYIRFRNFAKNNLMISEEQVIDALYKSYFDPSFKTSDGYKKSTRISYENYYAKKHLPDPSSVPACLYPSDIKKVIFNPPATIVFWNNNTKTVVKCMDGDIWDPEKGLSMAICKKMFGNEFHAIFKQWIPDSEYLSDFDIAKASFCNWLKDSIGGIADLAKNIKLNMAEYDDNEEESNGTSDD